MPVKTYEITHQRILESGRIMFLKNGYERTNLRELCKGAGITTGAFYRHFEDKEALFGALVEPAIEGIYSIYNEAEKLCFDYMEEVDIESLFEVSEEAVVSLLRFVYTKFDSFKLLLQCADGTKYVSFMNDLVELEAANFMKMQDVLKAHGIAVKELSWLELHMLSHSYFSCLFEGVMHDYPEEEMLQYAPTMVGFFSAGWRNVLGL